MCFQLNVEGVLKTVFERVPVDSIELVVTGLALPYVYRLLAFIAKVSTHGSLYEGGVDEVFYVNLVNATYDAIGLDVSSAAKLL